MRRHANYHRPRFLALFLVLALIGSGRLYASGGPAPTHVVALAVSVQSVDLSWAAPAGSAVASYSILRDGQALATVAADHPYYVDTSVQPGGMYQYRVLATDTAGQQSTASDAVQATVPLWPESPDTLAPTPPADLTVDVQSGQIVLDWYAADDDSDVTGYLIMRNGQRLAMVDSGTQIYRDTNVAPGTSYSYTILTTDSVGNLSAPASTGAVQALDAPHQADLPLIVAPPQAAGPDTPSAQATLAGYTSQLRRYPYLTDLVASYATINWATDRTYSSGYVTWGKAGIESCSAHSASATRYSISVNSVGLYQWRAELNLEPNTYYCYRVFLGSGATAIDLLGSDASPTFWTQIPAGSTMPFRFAILGDWGDVDNAAVPQAALMARLADSGARFAFTTGDNGYPSGSQKNYGDLVQTGTSISGVFGPNFWAVPGRSMALFPALGNHGITNGDAVHPHLLNWPQTRAVALSGGRYVKETYSGQNGTTTANYPSAWYAFDAGIARFYVLDAAWADTNIGTASSVYEVDYNYHWAPSTPQYQWLVNDLASHPNAVKFVFFHYPMYSDNKFQNSNTFLHGSNSLEGLLINAGVKFVFNGHAHIYQRSVVNGLTSYVLGTTGVRLAPLDGGCSSVDAYGLGYSNSKAKVYACGAAQANPPSGPEGIYNYVTVDVSSTAVTITPVDQLGRTFDQQVFPLSGQGDTTPPSVPGGVNASAASSTQVNVSWNASTDNVGVTGYDIFRDGSLVGSVGAVTAYSDMSAASSTTYSYTVRARDAAGNVSAESSPATVTTPAGADTMAPSVPGGVSATAVSTSQVNLSWNASSDNVGVTGYDIYRDGAVLASVGAVTTYSDTTVAPSTTYGYTVRARDAAGNVSVQSSPPASVTTPAVTDPTPPSVPGNLAASVVNTKIALSWSPSTDNIGVARYELFRDGWLLATLSTATNYNDTAVTPSTSYSYQVRAVDTSGNASALSSPPVSVTMPPVTDTTAPAAPTGVVATVNGSGQISVTWNAATDNVGVVGYDIYRVGNRIGSVDAVTSYVDLTVSQNSSYSYRVYAKDAAGNISGQSSPSSSVTTPAASETEVPTTPRDIAVEVVSSRQVNLTWSPSTDNIAVSSYEIFRDSLRIASVGAITSFSDTTVQQSTNYLYQVRARDVNGNASSLSSPRVGATTPADPPPPTGTDTTAPSVPDGMSATAASSSQVDLSWNAATDNVGVTGYDIYRDGALLASVGAVTSYSDTTAAPSTTYSYTVSAKDAAGNTSAQSGSASAITPAAADTTAPSAPSGLAATAPNTNQVDLNWNAATDNVSVTGYDIFRDGAPLGSVAAVTSYSDTTVVPSTAYSYTVRAKDAAGNNSALSSSANVTTPAPPDITAPSAPTGVSATVVSSSQVDVSWNAATDNVGVTGYDIYRNGSLLRSVSTVTSYSDRNANPTTTYSYTVRAKDAAGNVSEQSAASPSVTTPEPPDVQDPTTPGNFTAVAVSGRQVNLTWSPSTDNVGVAGYEIYRDNVRIAEVGQVTSFSDTTVQPRTSYRYSVRARDVNGNVSSLTKPAIKLTTPAS